MARIRNEVGPHPFQALLFGLIVDDDQNEIRCRRQIAGTRGPGHVDGRHMSLEKGFGRNLFLPVDPLRLARGRNTVEGLQKGRRAQGEGQGISGLDLSIIVDRGRVDITGNAPPIGNETGNRQGIDRYLHAGSRPHAPKLAPLAGLQPHRPRAARRKRSHRRQDDDTRQGSEHGDSVKYGRHGPQHQSDEQKPAGVAEPRQRSGPLKVYGQIVWRSEFVGHLQLQAVAGTLWRISSPALAPSQDGAVVTARDGGQS